MKTSTKNRARRFMVGAFEIKEKDEGRRTFRGTLATSHLDLGDGWRRDIVHPGAFKRTLDHFRGAGEGYVPLIDQHNYDSILNVYGHMLAGEEVLTGDTLSYELKGGGVVQVAEMKLDTEWQVIDGPDGERLLDRVRPGSVRKMSMGYEAIRADEMELKDYGTARNLREVGLKEGSLVIFPMNPNADVDAASVKSLFDALRDGTLTEEQEEELRALPHEAKARVRALLSESDPPEEGTPAGKGLAPDDPKRLQMEEMLRDIQLRTLAA